MVMVCSCVDNAPHSSPVYFKTTHFSNWILIAGVALAIIATLAALDIPRVLSNHWHFFAMGAAVCFIVSLLCCCCCTGFTQSTSQPFTRAPPYANAFFQQLQESDRSATTPRQLKNIYSLAYCYFKANNLAAGLIWFAEAAKREGNHQRVAALKKSLELAQKPGVQFIDPDIFISHAGKLVAIQNNLSNDQNEKNNLLTLFTKEARTYLEEARAK